MCLLTYSGEPISVSAVFKSPFTGLFFTDTQEQNIIAESELSAHLQKYPCCYFTLGRIGSKRLLMDRIANPSQSGSHSRLCAAGLDFKRKTLATRPSLHSHVGFLPFLTLPGGSVQNLGLFFVCSALVVEHNTITFPRVRLWTTIVFPCSDL